MPMHLHRLSAATDGTETKERLFQSAPCIQALLESGYLGSYRLTFMIVRILRSIFSDRPRDVLIERPEDYGRRRTMGEFETKTRGSSCRGQAVKSLTCVIARREAVRSRAS